MNLRQIANITTAAGISLPLTVVPTGGFDLTWIAWAIFGGNGTPILRYLAASGSKWIMFSPPAALQMRTHIVLGAQSMADYLVAAAEDLEPNPYRICFPVVPAAVSFEMTAAAGSMNLIDIFGVRRNDTK